MIHQADYIVRERFEDRLNHLVELYTNGNKSKFAELVDMTPQTFNNYIQGNRKPGWDVMKRFLSLGVNLNWLIAGIPPIKTDDISEAGVSKINTMRSPAGEDYFSDIDQEGLNEAEKNLLVEVKQFSDFLETRPLNPHIKRLLLELLIQSIDQALQPPPHDPDDS